MNKTKQQNSLGIYKKKSETRVVVAMSGGVDSSVVAAMLKEEGYDVIGITLQLYNHGEAIKRKNSCCAGQDIDDAKNVAHLLDFPHYVLDYEDLFKQQVIDDFADSYVKGETPIPCIRCNQTVKFKDLLKVAKNLKADCMATGHYIERKIIDNKATLFRGKHEKKDQSYFLFTTTQEQIDFLRFPLGGIKKTETRKYAKKYNLSVASKPESQDICFVPDGKYANLVKKLRPKSLCPGNIVDLEGNILGTHNGIINYTIGQRKGLGIGGRKDDQSPLYVIKIVPEEKLVVVGDKKYLEKKRIILNDVNWLYAKKLDKKTPIQVKIRSTTEPVPASIHINENNKFEVTLDKEEMGISPGQACVFYNNNALLGGGWIKKAF